MNNYDINEINNKLVKWKNPPSIDDLKENFDSSSSYHNVHVNNVNEWYSILRGDIDFEIEEGRSSIVPKVARKFAEWRYASLEAPFLSSDKLFDIEPSTHLDVESSKQNQIIINKQFNVDIPKVKFINEYVRTAVNTGTILVKLGWESEDREVREEYEEPVVVSNEQEIIQFLRESVDKGEIGEHQVEQLYMTSLQQLQQTQQPIEIGTTKKVRLVTKTVINRPVLEIRDSREVIIDPTCEGDINNARFIIDTFVSDLSSLKKDGRYKNLEYINVDNSSPDVSSFNYNSEIDHIASFKFNDEPRKKLQVFEYWGYWDINDTGIVEPIIVTYVGDTIIRMEVNPYPDKLPPFILVKYIPSLDLKSPYGEPDTALLKDNQKIIAAITRGTLDLFGRCANAQRGVSSAFLDEDNLAKFNNGKDFTFNPTNNIKDSYFMTSYPEAPNSVFNLLSWQNTEAETITGVKAFSNEGLRGESLGASVGGIRSTLDATSKREAGILHRLSEGLISVVKKIVSMNSVWLSDEEIVRTTDNKFVAIKRDDLAGNFDIKVTISTPEEDNHKANQLAFLLQTMGNTFDFNIVKMIMTKIADLHKIPDLSHAISNYEPQPDPIQQKLSEIQLATAEAELHLTKSKADENLADIEHKKARTAKEVAQAKLLTSNSDMVDLNFINKATGLEQEQELEKTLANKQQKGDTNE